MSFVATSAPSGGGSGSSLIWLWILIGAVVLVSVSVVVLVLVRRRVGRYVGRGSVVVGGWLSGAIDVSEKGSALHHEISAALRPDEPAAARWPGIQRRAGDLARELEDLRETAPESEDQARVTDALEILQSLRSAMDGQNAAGGADAEQAQLIQARLDAFEVSLRRLRSRQRHLW